MRTNRDTLIAPADSSLASSYAVISRFSPDQQTRIWPRRGNGNTDLAGEVRLGTITLELAKQQIEATTSTETESTANPTNKKPKTRSKQSSAESKSSWSNGTVSVKLLHERIVKFTSPGITIYEALDPATEPVIVSRVDDKWCMRRNQQKRVFENRSKAEQHARKILGLKKAQLCRSHKWSHNESASDTTAIPTQPRDR